MKTYELKKLGEELLYKHNIKDGDIKAKELLISILNITKEQYIIIQNMDIVDNIKERYLEGIDKLIKGIPLEYIIGYTTFMGRKYIVNKNVLIPRLDTEILVDAAVEYINKHNLENILEIGTGSGIIAITIAKETKRKYNGSRYIRRSS